MDSDLSRHNNLPNGGLEYSLLKFLDIVISNHTFKYSDADKKYSQ